MCLCSAASSTECWSVPGLCAWTAEKHTLALVCILGTSSGSSSPLSVPELHGPHRLVDILLAAKVEELAKSSDAYAGYFQACSFPSRMIWWM